MHRGLIFFYWITIAKVSLWLAYTHMYILFDTSDIKKKNCAKLHTCVGEFADRNV